MIVMIIAIRSTVFIQLRPKLWDIYSLGYKEYTAFEM